MILSAIGTVGLNPVANKAVSVGNGNPMRLFSLGSLLDDWLISCANIVPICSLSNFKLTAENTQNVIEIPVIVHFSGNDQFQI